MMQGLADIANMGKSIKGAFGSGVHSAAQGASVNIQKAVNEAIARGAKNSEIGDIIRKQMGAFSAQMGTIAANAAKANAPHMKAFVDLARASQSFESAIGSKGWRGIKGSGRIFAHKATGAAEDVQIKDATDNISKELTGLGKALGKSNLASSAINLGKIFDKDVKAAKTREQRLAAIEKARASIEDIRVRAAKSGKAEYKAVDATASALKGAFGVKELIGQKRSAQKAAALMDSIAGGLSGLGAIARYAQPIMGVAKGAWEAYKLVEDQANRMARIQMATDYQRGAVGRAVRGAGINYASLMSAIGTGRKAGMEEGEVIGSQVAIQQRLAQARWGEGTLIQDMGRWGLSPFADTGQMKDVHDVMIDISNKFNSLRDKTEQLQFLGHMQFSPEQMEYVRDYAKNAQIAERYKENPELRGTLEKADILDESGFHARVDAASRQEARRIEILNQNAWDKGWLSGAWRQANPENWFFKDYNIRQRGLASAKSDEAMKALTSELEKLRTTIREDTSSRGEGVGIGGGSGTGESTEKPKEEVTKPALADAVGNMSLEQLRSLGVIGHFDRYRADTIPGWAGADVRNRGKDSVVYMLRESVGNRMRDAQTELGKARDSGDLQTQADVDKITAQYGISGLSVVQAQQRLTESALSGAWVASRLVGAAQYLPEGADMPTVEHLSMVQSDKIFQAQAKKAKESGTRISEEQWERAIARVAGGNVVATREELADVVGAGPPDVESEEAKEDIKRRVLRITKKDKQLSYEKAEEMAKQERINEWRQSLSSDEARSYVEMRAMEAFAKRHNGERPTEKQMRSIEFEHEVEKQRSIAYGEGGILQGRTATYDELTDSEKKNRLISALRAVKDEASLSSAEKGEAALASLGIAGRKSEFERLESSKATVEEAIARDYLGISGLIYDLADAPAAQKKAEQAKKEAEDKKAQEEEQKKREQERIAATEELARIQGTEEGNKLFQSVAGSGMSQEMYLKAEEAARTGGAVVENEAANAGIMKQYETVKGKMVERIIADRKRTARATAKPQEDFAALHEEVFEGKGGGATTTLRQVATMKRSGASDEEVAAMYGAEALQEWKSAATSGTLPESALGDDTAWRRRIGPWDTDEGEKPIYTKDGQPAKGKRRGVATKTSQGKKPEAINVRGVGFRIPKAGEPESQMVKAKGFGISGTIVPKKPSKYKPRTVSYLAKTEDEARSRLEGAGFSGEALEERLAEWRDAAEGLYGKKRLNKWAAEAAAKKGKKKPQGVGISDESTLEEKATAAEDLVSAVAKTDVVDKMASAAESAKMAAASEENAKAAAEPSAKEEEKGGATSVQVSSPNVTINNIINDGSDPTKVGAATKDSVVAATVEVTKAIEDNITDIGRI